MRYDLTLCAIAIALCASAAMPAAAADQYVDVEATPVEIGSQWYIRGDIGLVADGERLFEDGTRGDLPGLPRTTSDSNGTFSIGAGVGVRFSPSLRGELNFAWDSRSEYGSAEVVTGAPDTIGTPCEYRLLDLDDDGVFETRGSAPNCLREDREDSDSQTVVADVLYDLPVEGRFRPFVGAGFGVRRIGYSANSERYTCVPLAGELCPVIGNNGLEQSEIGVPFSNKGIDVTGSAYHLVGRVTGGLGIQVAPNTNIDLSYSYTKTMQNALWGGSSAHDLIGIDTDNHHLKLGVRYDLW